LFVTQNFEECIGGCSGVDTNALKHEFHTTIAKAELSTALLGEEGVAAAEANCTPKQTQIFVDLFDGGDSFVSCTHDLLRFFLTAQIFFISFSLSFLLFSYMFAFVECVSDRKRLLQGRV
jgi:hypothetical protein